MNPADSSKTDPVLQIIRKFLKSRKKHAYLVGGFLRDSILRRKKDSPDIDLAVEKGAINLARDFSRYLNAGFVVLDKKHGAARVVKSYKGKLYTIDFTDFRGRTLEEDLSLRDFTINAMAQDISRPQETIDPYNANKDLRHKVIRALKPGTFKDDPLRILRAFSLSAIFKFEIEKSTLELIRKNTRRLKGVSFERIRDELFKIFHQDNASKYFKELDDLGILAVVIPEIEVMRGLRQGPYHHLDVWGHALETLRQVELAISELRRNKLMQAYLNESVSSDRKRAALIKFGALLHDIGKPKSLRREGKKLIFHGHERIGRDMVKVIAERLKLSNDEKEALARMVYWHLRPGFLADSDIITPRATFRYFRDTQKEALSILLISLADQRATKGPKTSRESRRRHEELVAYLIKEYFKQQKKKKLARLITGDDLIKELRLKPSPLFAKILREVEELQASGEIRTKRQALDAARGLI